MSDPYATLGLAHNASEDDIRAAYRRKAAHVHPDLQPTEKKAWAAEQMRALNAARDWLLDPERRAALNPRPAGPTAERYSPPADMWSDRAQSRRVARQLRQLILGVALIVSGVGCLLLAVFSPNSVGLLANTAVRVIGSVLMFGGLLLAPTLIALLLGLFFFAIRKS